MIGLIPCGGRATRISPLPCSKELFPVGLRNTVDGSLRPKVVSHYLLEKMHRGGITKAYFILRKGKWDIPEYYGDGSSFGMNIGYLMMRIPHGPAYTLDQAYPFVKGARIAIGFPDILFEPIDAFRRGVERLDRTDADLVLGLYPAHDIRVWDIVVADRSGRVQELLIKPNSARSKLAWVFALWTGKFTEFLHEYLSRSQASKRDADEHFGSEVTVGEVIQAAVREGISTQSVIFRRHDYWDIGTPKGLKRLVAPNMRGEEKSSRSKCRKVSSKYK
jgi:glucose-1-phosphate thymidylyltransferase